LQLRFQSVQPGVEGWTAVGFDAEETHANRKRVPPDYFCLGLQVVRAGARKLELHCDGTLDRGRPEMGDRQSTFTDVEDFPNEGLAAGAGKGDGQVNFVPEISAMLAFHPGKRQVEEAVQVGLLNRFAQHEIRPCFDGRAYAGCAVQDREDNRLFVGPAVPYPGERSRGSTDIVAVDDKTIDVPAAGEFEGAGGISAQLKPDTHRTEAGPHHLEQR
jgi:hypothetical protein